MDPVVYTNFYADEVPRWVWQKMARVRKASIGTDGKPMTPWQLWLRRLCVAVIAWAVIQLVLGIFVLLMTVSLPEGILDGIEVFIGFVSEENWAFLGGSALVSSFLNVVIAFLGIRGAENPQKIGVFFWIALVDATITAWALAGNLSNGLFDLSSTLSSLFIIVLAVCAWQVRKQTGYFDSNRELPDGEVIGDASPEEPIAFCDDLSASNNDELGNA